MLVKSLRWVLAFAVGVLGTAVLAQVPNQCAVMGVGAMMYGDAYKPNAPYSATVQTTHEQKLADGNAIHGSVTTHQARDSAGRIRSESSSGCAIGSDGQTKPVVRVSVYDPGIRTTLSWSVNDPSASANVVRVIHQPEPAPVAPSPATVQRQQAAQVRQRRQQSPFHREDIGSRNIEGVTTEGSRTTHTIPAGQMGNDQPIEIVDEIWIAKDLGLAMLRIDDDPLSGRISTEVVELNQAEPDAALFAPPAGYKIEEVVTKSVSSAGSQ
jgi:hypothetical protein